MCGKFIKDQIYNNTLCAQLSMVSIEEKIREYKLQWFEYMQGRPLDTVIKRYIMSFY